MDKKKEKPENEEFIKNVKLINKKISFGDIDKLCGFRKGFSYDVTIGRSSAKSQHLTKLVEQFSNELNQDQETITEKIKRIEEENEKLFADVQALKAKLFDLENNCK
jgi:hypothetical protein